MMSWLHALFQQTRRTVKHLQLHVRARLKKPHRGDVAQAFTVHLGHHFWGMGNVGDDFMLKGFLQALKRHSNTIRITCCAQGDLSQLATRFPEIDWLPYTLPHRLSALSVASAWVGIGGTPFQNDSGSWMEQHLDEERCLCEAFGVPMDFLAIGVGNRSALEQSGFLRVVRAARHLWARDEASYDALMQIAPGRVSLGADLANLLFQNLPAAAPLSAGSGLLIHSEREGDTSMESLKSWLPPQPSPCFWLVQEQRKLPGSEKARWETFPSELRQQLILQEPDWQASSVEALAASWPFPAQVVSSRYHGALLAAWRGCALTILARNDKLSGLARALGLEPLGFKEAGTSLLDATSAGRQVERSHLLQLATQAEAAVKAWIQQLSSPLARAPQVQSPRPRLQQSARRLIYRTLLHLAQSVSPQGPRQHFRLTLLKLDKLGDAVLALGAIRVLTRHFGEAQTLLIVSPLAEPLMRREFPQATLLILPAFCERLFPDLVQTLFAQAPRLRALSTETLICLRHQPSDYLHGIASLIQSNQIYASTWTDSRENLSLGFPGAHYVPYPPRDESAKTCRELLAHQRVIEAALPAPLSEEEYLPRFQTQPAPQGAHLLICPATGSALREYPLPLLLEALQLFHQSQPEVTLRVCLPPEANLGFWRSHFDRAPFPAMEWVVPESSAALLEEISQAGVILAPESAPAHMAAALDQPGVFILGGGHRGLLAPWSRSHRQQWLSHRMPCEGCHWHCIQTTPHCITQVAPADVAAALVKAYALSRQK